MALTTSVRSGSLGDRASARDNGGHRAVGEDALRMEVAYARRADVSWARMEPTRVEPICLNERYISMDRR